MCWKINTELVKDDKIRRWVLKCRDCRATRRVPTIKGSEKKFEEYEREMKERERKEGMKEES